MQNLDQLLKGELKGFSKIKLSCKLKSFPTEILELADTLEILDLSGNELSELPDNFYKLHKLKIAFFSNNEFTEFPTVLSKCQNLEMVAFKANQIEKIDKYAIPSNIRWLILTDNNISSIPKSIGNCKNLQKCMLAGNKISKLPLEISNCSSLELLRISANKLTQFPTQLFDLPKLSWLAISGNPFSIITRSVETLNEIDYNDLTIEDALGEGASGVISKAFWKSQRKYVAVKVFKGEVTSDGLPFDEMQACINAGNHKNMVPLLAKLINHPENKNGLVLELIPKSYSNLGSPPDFKSCTRDNYAENTAFGFSQIIKISLDIASAASHLHANGIMHGDLYAHNVLVNMDFHALLGDFGAASIYNKHSNEAKFFERIEVRAFGYLLEDMLDRIDGIDKANQNFNELVILKQSCLSLDLASRPTFNSICTIIKALI